MRMHMTQLPIQYYRHGASREEDMMNVQARQRPALLGVSSAAGQKRRQMGRASGNVSK